MRVPTLEGAVELAIPAGTNSGRTFRLKGKGFPAKGGAGDLLATVRIMLPEGSDAELDELMRKWREEKPYDPREGMALSSAGSRAARAEISCISELRAAARLSICS